MTTHETDLTELLRAWGRAEDDAVARVVPRVVDELHRLARHHTRRLGSTPTLQPTAIVNEAYLRLAQRDSAVFPSRAHFFAFASKLIRELLIDHLRARGARKRGADAVVATLGAAERRAVEEPLEPETVLAVHELLEVLERRDPRRARIVELRFFGGLRMAEIAEVTGRSLASVERDWQVARRWFASELADPG